MNKQRKKGNKFLQTISFKITNIQTAYNINEDYPNLSGGVALEISKM